MSRQIKVAQLFLVMATEWGFGSRLFFERPQPAGEDVIQAVGLRIASAEPYVEETQGLGIEGVNPQSRGGFV